MSRNQKIFLGFILVMAAAVRLWGIGWGLPFPYHPDEGTIIFRAMAFGSGDLNPHFFRWPSLPMYLMFFVYGSWYVMGYILGAFSNSEDFLRLYIEDPTCFWILGRLMSAVASMMTVALTFILGRKLYSVSTGLMASLFLSVAYLHVRDSHYCTPDVLLTFLMTVSLWFILQILEKGDLKSYVLAGLFAGLAASTKYVGGATVCISIFLAFLWNSVWDRSKGSAFPETGRLLACAATALIAFVAGTPFSLLDYGTFIQDVLVQANMVEPGKAAGSALVSYLSGLRKIFFTILWNGLGAPMFLASVAGMLLALLRGPARSLALWIYWVPYAIVFSVFSIHRATYFTPLVPVFCLFAAFFVSHLIETTLGAAQANLGKRWPVYAVPAIILVFSGFQVATFNSIISTRDTRTEAKAWVESNIPENSVILKGGYTPVLNRTSYQLARFVEEDTVEHRSWDESNRMKNTLEYELFKNKHPQYHVYEMPSWKFLPPGSQEFISMIDFARKHGVEYVIVSSKDYLNFVNKSAEEFESEPLRDRVLLYEWLETDAHIVKIFRSECRLPVIDNPEGYTFHNPVIKIYRL